MNENERAVVLEALENTLEAFVTIDETHRVVFFNRAAENLFGRPRAEVIGRDLNAILTPDCSRDHRAAVRRYLAERVLRRLGHETELTITRRSGDKVPAAISFSVSEVEGRTYFTGLLRDLTESRTLREQVARAEQLSALGRLVAEVTHEIRNPLVIIGMMARSLLDTAGAGEQAEKLKVIRDEAARLDKLYQELNQYYRPRPLNLAPLDVGELLRDVCALVGAEAKERRIDFACEPGATPLRVRGNSDKLKQVIINLARNAMEAMETGGRLAIRAVSNEADVEIRVADTGPGIPADRLTEVFEPFVSTKKRGAGLGLAVSKRIIDAHPGGRISVDSRPEEGTVFTVSLPALADGTE